MQAAKNRSSLFIRMIAGAMLVWLCGGAICRAQGPVTQPAAPAGVDPAVEKVLDDIQKKSADIKTLQAKIRYDAIDNVAITRERRLGSLDYVSGPPAGFRAHFDKITIGDRAEDCDTSYIFDGVYLVERVVGANGKRFARQRLVPPVGPGAAPGIPALAPDANPLAFGRGPFPLPINLDKTIMLNRYVVTLVPPGDKADPADGPTIHLKLVPRPEQRVDFTQAHLWYARATLVPRKVRTIDSVKGTEKVVDLTDVVTTGSGDVNPAVAKALDTSLPTGPGWDIEDKAWQAPKDK